jgi:hypothetical protein
MFLRQEIVMLSAKITLDVQTVVARSNETAEKTPGVSHAYRAPALHVVGKAGELVQGGGGSYADNNRARQY